MESNKSLALKELSNILDLATCDDTLFNDGINLEIEACAKKGIEVLDNKEIVYVIMETYGIDDTFAYQIRGVYSNLEKAQTKLKDIIKEAKSKEYEFETVEENANEYQTWSEGYFDKAHYHVRIIKQEVQDA